MSLFLSFLRFDFDFDTNSGKTNKKTSHRNEKSLRYSQVFVITEFDTNEVEMHLNIRPDV